MKKLNEVWKEIVHQDQVNQQPLALGETAVLESVINSKLLMTIDPTDVVQRRMGSSFQLLIRILRFRRCFWRCGDWAVREPDGIAIANVDGAGAGKFLGF